MIPEGFRGCLGRRIALIRPRRDVVDPRFLHLVLRGPAWRSTVEKRLIAGAAVDRIPLINFPEFPISILPLHIQRRVSAVVGAFDELIAINERRVEVLDELARLLYREWFVRFRFPGHRESRAIKSEFGKIPAGWEVQPIATMASKVKGAISSGPFGSKLGRNDYVVTGVPVIRGANLAVGGGFEDDGFVFVSEAKADTLRSSIAHPGDIVITQRGTLGQVGLVPMEARYARYVISQSQMKITTGAATSTQYLYALLRAPEMTRRILNMAISAGVPHINLGLLREMRIVVPPIGVQMAFEALVAPLSYTVEQHRCTIAQLATVRDLLLPRLVSGRLDIANVELGKLLSADAA